jgi:DNA-binding transcriptional MocR family regulator
MAGDPLTIGRVEGRQLLGSGWVSHLLQQTAAELWSSVATRKLLARAEKSYAARRAALVDALAARGIEAQGDSGLSVWIPVVEEVATVQQLLDSGWAVSPGERFRFESPAGIRVTTATLEPDDAEELADALAALWSVSGSTYAA